MAEGAETPPPAARLISRAQMARARSVALRSQSVAARSRSHALTSHSVTVMSRSQALMSHSAAVMSRMQALRARPVRGQAWAACRGQAGGRVFVSPATVRAQVTLTYRELAAAAHRRAIGRARELGLLDG